MSVFALPDLDDGELAPFWDGARAGALRIPRCLRCAAFVWYPQLRCRRCGSEELRWTAVSGRARLFTWVTVHRALVPAQRDHVPFVTALVEIEEDASVRLATRLDAPRGVPLRLGLPLEVFFEKVDDRLTVPRFRAAAGERP